MDAVLVVITQPRSPEVEPAYNAWYTEQHLPDVLAVPGYVHATRYRRSETAKLSPEPIVPQPYLALYYLEIEGRPALQATSDEHMRRIRAGEMRGSDAIDPDMRAEYYERVAPRFGADGREDPDGVLLVFSAPTPGMEDEYQRWYNEVHIPQVCGIPGIVGASRYRAADIDMIGRGRPLPPRYLAIYDLWFRNGVTAASVAGDIARWSRDPALLVQSPAFDAGSARAQIYERISPRISA